MYFFLLESSGRTLEEIDTMYILHVKPTKSSKWQAPEGDDLEAVQKAATGPVSEMAGADHVEDGVRGRKDEL